MSGLENFFWVAAGIAVLLAGLGLFLALVRVRRTLAILEVTLLTAEESMRETIPVIRGGLGNVSDITAGLNVALRATGGGVARLGEGAGRRAGGARRAAAAAWHGAKVGAGSLWRSYEQAERSRAAGGGGGDG